MNDPVQKTTSRFTGWTDIDLSKRGYQQAKAAGRALRDYKDRQGRGLKIDAAFCSLLRRADDTLDIMAEEMGLKDRDCFDFPITYSWRLNERHYGDLVGM